MVALLSTCKKVSNPGIRARVDTLTSDTRQVGCPLTPSPPFIGWEPTETQYFREVSERNLATTEEQRQAVIETSTATVTAAGIPHTERSLVL